MEQTLNTWSVGIAYALFFVTGFVIWLLWLRGHYAKQVIGKVYCEFITPEGNAYSRLVPVHGDKLIISPKKDKPGRIFNVRDIVTFTVDYPPMFASIKALSTKVKKASFFEDCWEPITNRKNTLVLTPLRLFNWGQERWSAIGAAQAEEKAGQIGIKRTPFNINWTVVIVILLIVIAAVVAFIYWQNGGSLDLTKAQQGIP